MKFSKIILIIIQKVKKNENDKEKESNNNSENEEKSNPNFSEIKKTPLLMSKKKILKTLIFQITMNYQIIISLYFTI